MLFLTPPPSLHIARRSKSQNEHSILKNQKTRNFIPSSLIISQTTLIKYLVFLNLFTHVQTSFLSPMSTPQGCQHNHYIILQVRILTWIQHYCQFRLQSLCQLLKQYQDTHSIPIQSVSPPFKPLIVFQEYVTFIL